MSKSRLIILVCIALALLTLAAYWRVLGSEFVGYDDDIYVTQNPSVQAGLTLQSARWAFTSGHASNWHPLTWISHMIDWRIYGPNALGHHLTNLILHALSTLLLFLLLRRMTGSTWRSAFVSALFAVHPLHVESVAWVAERKDVLSTLLWVLTLHAYVSYVRQSGWGRYVLTLGLFVLGIMAKPMLVTLPITLLLLDYWPLGPLAEKKSSNRVSAWKLVWEKAPFFAVTAASCVVTYIVQSRESVVEVDAARVGIRVANALVAYVAYLLKMVWPQRLAAIYPHPLDTIPVWQVIGSALLLVAVSVLVLRAGRTRPYLAFGWFWYVITLIPVIGLVQVGYQAMADRYTYVPLIGVFIALTWAIAEGVGEREKGRKGAPISPIRPFTHSPVLAVLAAAIIAACTAGAWHQTGYWRNSLLLFQRAVDVTKDNFVAEGNLGKALIDQGRYEECIEHVQAAIKITPTPRLYSIMGTAYLRMDKMEDATECFGRAIDLNQDYFEAQCNLGFALMALGRTDEAIKHFARSAELRPDESGPHFGLGLAHTQQGQTGDAIREYTEAVRLDPNNASAHNELGLALLGQGKIDEAVEHLEAAVRAHPDPVTYYRLGSIFANQQKIDQAIECFRQAVELNAEYPEAHYDLAVALSAKGQMDEAIEHYSEAVKLAPGYGNAHRNLAIALFFAGDYARAWTEVGLARKCGIRLESDFTKALSEKMPEPGR